MIVPHSSSPLCKTAYRRAAALGPIRRPLHVAAARALSGAANIALREGHWATSAVALSPLNPGTWTAERYARKHKNVFQCHTRCILMTQVRLYLPFWSIKLYTSRKLIMGRKQTRRMHNGQMHKQTWESMARSTAPGASKLSRLRFLRKPAYGKAPPERSLYYNSLSRSAKEIDKEQIDLFSDWRKLPFVF